ncbi:MAG: hypothetical protein JXM69_18960 [Anaerolineae bacterium]|nr:hypothetical protein [Anaerolineae bacterium]
MRIGIEPAGGRAFEPAGVVDRGVSSRARHGVVGIEEIDRCPHCGAEATLFKRGEFERVK